MDLHQCHQWRHEKSPPESWADPLRIEPVEVMERPQDSEENQQEEASF